MDCRTARHYLDCLHDGTTGFVEDPPATSDGHEAVSQQDLSEHMDSCSACRQLLDEWQHFDRRMYSMLMSSPVPPELEARLLQAVDQEFAFPGTVSTPQRSPAPAVAGRRRRTRLWTTLTLTMALLVAGTFWWTRPRPDELLSYHGAGQLLAEHFLKSNAAWEDLDQFDGNFDLGSYQSDLGLFQLSPAHGIDLGGGRSQDAAVFEFGLKNWKGIITVLPSQHFTGLPDINTPNVQAGHSVLQWRSSDGKLTYLCFVHRGSAAALAMELFGLLT